MNWLELFVEAIFTAGWIGFWLLCATVASLLLWHPLEVLRGNLAARNERILAEREARRG